MSGTKLRRHPARTRYLKTANMAGTQSRWLHVEEETLVNAAAPNFMARPEGLNKHERASPRTNDMPMLEKKNWQFTGNKFIFSKRTLKI